MARDWVAARNLRNLALRHQVIHTNALETARIGWALHRATGLPWVHSEHSSEWCVPTATGAAAAITALGRRAVRDATRTTAVSRFLADAIQSHTGVEPVVVPNVLDMSPTRRLPRRPDDPIRIVTSAGFVHYKDPILAVQVVAEVRRALDREVTWTWIGVGPLEEAFRAEVARRGLDSVTQVLTPMEPEAYWAELRKADVFFLPSRFETFCVAGAEALGVGIPVVLGPRGGHREFADDGVGAIAREQSQAAYVRALASVVERLGTFDPLTLHARIGPFSQDRVRAAFAEAYSPIREP